MNIDKQIQFHNSPAGQIQVWKVWQVAGGQGYKVTLGSQKRSNENVIFQHTNKKRALSFASDFKDGFCLATNILS